MKMSEQGMKLLHEREGRRTKAYRDSRGYWTIGLGHLLSTDKNADLSHVVWTQAQVEEEMKAQESSGGGGIGGMLARRMVKKDPPKPRALLLTMNHEFQEVATAGPTTDLEMPAGYKEKK